MVEKRLAMGDAVETRVVALGDDGMPTEKWLPGTVCYSGFAGIGVAYSDGERRLFPLESEHIRAMRKEPTDGP